MHISPRSARTFTARVFIALVVGFVLVSGTLWAEDRYGQAKVSDIKPVRFKPGQLNDHGAVDDPGKPANFLIVGSDSRAFVQSAVDQTHFGNAASQTGQRSDTIMIAHIDPNAKQAVLVSFPRDTQVTLPGGCVQKINAAFNKDFTCGGMHGGPQMLVQTIHDNFGVDVNHYLEVDFVGFRQIVDVLGSVPIYFPAKALDTYTGLDVAQGCQHLTGIMALNYARSRHYQYFDYVRGRWREDPTSDFGRIRRQQYLVRTMLQTAIDQGARNPFTADALISRMVGSISADAQFNLGDVKRLLRTFRLTDPGSIAMQTLPVTAGTQGRLVLRQPDAEHMLETLRTFTGTLFKPVAVVPAQVTVEVRNGTRKVGVAKQATTDFASFGFVTVPPGTVAPAAQTEVHFAPAAASKAILVARYLGGAAKLVPETTVTGADVVVVIGPDFRGVTKPGTPVASTAPPTSTTRPVPTTTTTVPKPNPGTEPAGTAPGSIGAQLIGCNR